MHASEVSSNLLFCLKATDTRGDRHLNVVDGVREDEANSNAHSSPYRSVPRGHVPRLRRAKGFRALFLLLPACPGKAGRNSTSGVPVQYNVEK